MTETIEGSCLCGAVNYQLGNLPKAISHCHCSQCRKSHGAAFASYGSVPRSDLQVTQGTDRLGTYPSSEGVLREFCRECGSSLFWSRSRGDYADWVSIALGTLDTPISLDKQKHVYVSSKAYWFEIEDHWPQHP